MPDADARSRFRWQGLLHAPVLIVPYVRPEDYADRYAEVDKAATGLGTGVDVWPVPYWWVDGGAVVQNLLLAATRSEEHKSELQSLMRISYAVFCLKKNTNHTQHVYNIIK